MLDTPSRVRTAAGSFDERIANAANADTPWAIANPNAARTWIRTTHGYRSIAPSRHSAPAPGAF